MRQASSHQTLHDLKNTLRRESHTYTGGRGSFPQAMCPPSRFPYIAVKFGAARGIWMDYVEGGVAEGLPARDEVYYPRSGQDQSRQGREGRL